MPKDTLFFLKTSNLIVFFGSNLRNNFVRLVYFFLLFIFVSYKIAFFVLFCRSLKNRHEMALMMIFLSAFDVSISNWLMRWNFCCFLSRRLRSHRNYWHIRDEQKLASKVECRLPRLKEYFCHELPENMTNW